MQDLIREVIKMTTPVNCEGIKVVGSSSTTAITVVDKEADLIVYCFPKEPIPEFEGKFGIPNLKVLNNLLSYDGYKANEAKIERFSRRDTDTAGNAVEVEVPKRIIFRDAKGGSATFFFSHGKNIAGADYPTIGWDMEFEPSREAIVEFSKLSMIFATAECGYFRAQHQDGTLKFSFGTEGSTTHHGDMVFEQNVRGTLVNNLAWSSSRFISVMKVVGTRGFKLAISNRGVMKIVTETDRARYEYWLRCVKI